MDKDAIIEQLKDAIDQFKRETELLKGRIKELEAKLAMYENAHTPPSLKRNGNRKKDQNEGGGKKPGQDKARILREGIYYYCHLQCCLVQKTDGKL